MHEQEFEMYTYIQPRDDIVSPIEAAKCIHGPVNDRFNRAWNVCSRGLSREAEDPRETGCAGIGVAYCRRRQVCYAGRLSEQISARFKLIE